MLCAVYQTNFPLIRDKLKYRNRKPWLTDDIRNAIKQKKNKLIYKLNISQIKKHHSFSAQLAYSEYKKKVNHKKQLSVIIIIALF